ncbi:trypsin-like peptidase domain-containing protein [Streptomyces sp. GXMU-J15]|uniref:Trypsin-like peptidase domain-containing protein n=2 Tax=Streptomyces TaxID=1883 RepID=A0ABT7J8N6_9ACTN|nr:trypsin-like peptidase domain-containing protein [Streptomyces fuscus]MDL2081140.1 trypsin-like peptidase domain-containing protein [Streptomyces fuscus]
MDEGKPTKAKRWGRSWLQGPSARTAEATPNADGDFELERPIAETSSDGDYELSRPGPPAPETAAPVSAHGSGSAGSTALDTAAPGEAPGAPGGSTASDGSEATEAFGATDAGAPGQAGASGAVGATASGASAAAPDAPPAPAGASAGVGAAEAATAPGTAAPAETMPPVSGAAPMADALAPAAPGAAAPVAAVPAEAHAADASAPADDRPRPLHDPDPYSTPPYGEPGPWAPAPPVQHPGTTPAHGTAVPAPLPAPAPAVPPAGPAPTQAVPPTGPAPTPAVPPTGPAPGTPTPAVQPAAPQSAAAPNPWQNYDPWATPGTAMGAPLQQNGAPVASEQQKRKRARKALVVGALVIALVSGGIGGAVGTYLERNGGVGHVELPQAAKEAPERAPDSVAGIAARALPSVVTLHVSGSDKAGTGTGFVLDDRGHILTNNHVVEPAEDGGEVSVTFHSGDTAKAKIIGQDSGYDLAVVKVSGVSGLTPMTLGNSDNVQVGDPVVAIGAPFDLAGTVTSGIISAKERPITAGGEGGGASDVSYVDALQTDAPINPGNSGGPLLNAKAQVIGINSAIRSADSGSDLDGGQAGSIGLGFAIPINQGKRVAEELINTGKATHPVIGVTLDMDYSGDGARVGTRTGEGGSPVTPGGPGDRAGIEPGDVITEVDGQRVHSGEELIVKTRAHRPGDRLELTLKRDGKEITISLTLGSSDGD